MQPEFQRDGTCVTNVRHHFNTLHSPLYSYRGIRLHRINCVCDSFKTQATPCRARKTMFNGLVPQSTKAMELSRFALMDQNKRTRACGLHLDTDADDGINIIFNVASYTTRSKHESEIPYVIQFPE